MAVNDENVPVRVPTSITTGIEADNMYSAALERKNSRNEQLNELKKSSQVNSNFVISC